MTNGVTKTQNTFSALKMFKVSVPYRPRFIVKTFLSGKIGQNKKLYYKSFAKSNIKVKIRNGIVQLSMILIILSTLSRKNLFFQIQLN